MENITETEIQTPDVSIEPAQEPEDKGLDKIRDAMFFRVLVNYSSGMSIKEACAQANVTKRRFDLWIARNPDAQDQVAQVIRAEAFKDLEEVARATNKILEALLVEAQNPEELSLSQKIRLHTHLMDYQKKFMDPKYLATPSKDRGTLKPPTSFVPSKDPEAATTPENMRDFVDSIRPQLKKVTLTETTREIKMEPLDPSQG